MSEIKDKIPRKKVYPEFYTMESSKELATTNISVTRQTHNRRETPDGFINSPIISPYTEYIPLLYLPLGGPIDNDFLPEESKLYTLLSHLGKLPGKDSKKRYMALSKIIKERVCGVKEFFLGEDISLGGDIIYNCKKEIEKWLLYDDEFHINSLSGSGVNTYLDDVCYNFYDSGREIHILKSSMRSYRCLTSLLTLIRTNSTIISPIVLAVVTPENYLYQKYHILVHGTIDLSRVIILVNREIDNIDYPTPALRRMYKSKCEPILKKLSSNIWKVPESFILEKCFVKPFSLDGKSIRGKAREKNRLISEFYESLKNDTEVESISPIGYYGGLLDSLSSTNDIRNMRYTYSVPYRTAPSIDSFSYGHTSSAVTYSYESTTDMRPGIAEELSPEFMSS